MRTKALFCAAAVAACALSAVAQNNVYSLNIVGYVNVTAPAGYSMLANPLKAGATNGANEVLPLTDGMVVLTYSGGAYQFYGYDTGAWIDQTGAPTQPPVIPPGKGFFYFNPAATAQTITFVGEVVPAPGTTNTMALPAGYSLVGSVLPVAGQLGTTATTGVPVVPGAVNIPIMDGMTILPYSNGAYAFQGFDGGWIDQTGGPLPAAPTISIGQGFFYFNPLATSVDWLQALP